MKRRYIMNTKNRKIHRPGCHAVANLHPRYIRTFDNLDAAVDAGGKACRNCLLQTKGYGIPAKYRGQF